MQNLTPAPIAWYLTSPQSCPYVPGREMQTVLVDPSATLGSAQFGSLLGEGFRRSGRFVYRHHCSACQACVPTRIPVARFRPNRSQTRTARRNADLTFRVARQPDLDEHVALLERYLRGRHPGGGMEHTGMTEYRGMIEARHSDVLLLELRLDERLLAVGVTDRTPQGLSAMYTFFDPDLPGRSLGTQMILSQVALASQWHLDHVYLGYWIADSEKMAYKAGFRGVEGRIRREWIPLRGSTPNTPL